MSICLSSSVDKEQGVLSQDFYVPPNSVQRRLMVAHLALDFLSSIIELLSTHSVCFLYPYSIDLRMSALAVPIGLETRSHVTTHSPSSLLRKSQWEIIRSMLC